MTLREIIADMSKLAKDFPEYLDTPGFAIHGASGSTYEIGSCHRKVKHEGEYDQGPTCDLENGKLFFTISVD